MKAWIWLRVLAGIMVILTVGHTIGFLKVPVAGPQASVFATMTGVHFPVMGFDRSYGDFYRGFGLFVSLEFVVLAVLALQLSAMARTDPRGALPLAITLEAACVGSAALSVAFFFAAPIVLSSVAAFSSTMALVAVARDARVTV